MKRARCLGLLLVPLLPATVRRGEKERGEPEDYAYIIRALNQTIQASCSGELRPDRAVVVGGVTAESLKPVEAKDELERANLMAKQKALDDSLDEARRSGVRSGWLQ